MWLSWILHLWVSHKTRKSACWISPGRPFNFQVYSCSCWKGSVLHGFLDKRPPWLLTWSCPNYLPVVPLRHLTTWLLISSELVSENQRWCHQNESHNLLCNLVSSYYFLTFDFMLIKMIMSGTDLINWKMLKEELDPPGEERLLWLVDFAELKHHFLQGPVAKAVWHETIGDNEGADSSSWWYPAREQVSVP